MISNVDCVSIQVPSFIAKLWDIVNNPSFQDIICWGESNNTFIIKNKEQLCIQVLPMYFKHSNLSSFIRQLNKYGFKKVNWFGNHNDLAYAHNSFLANDPLALVNIKKKESIKSEPLDSEDVGIEDLLNKVRNLKKSQDKFEGKLKYLGSDSKQLWAKTIELKKKQRVQQKIISNIMAFLADIISQNDNDMDNISLLLSENLKKCRNNMIGVREMPLMIKSKGDSIFCLPERNTHATNNVNMPSATGNSNEYVDPLSSSLINSLLSDKGKICTNKPDDIDDNMSISISDDDSFDSSIADMTDLQNKDQQLVQVQPIVTSLNTDGSLLECVPLSKIISGMKIDVNTDINSMILPENNCSPQGENVMHITNSDDNKNGSNFDSILTPDDNSSAVNDILVEIPDGGEDELLQEYLPSGIQTKELGDHVDSMDSHLTSLKELMCDTDLNLDINEVEQLFSPEEIASLSTSSVDSILASNLAEEYPNILPSSDPILDASEILRSPS